MHAGRGIPVTHLFLCWLFVVVLGTTDNTYNIKYVLGGSEKNVPRKFITCIDLNSKKVVTNPARVAARAANKENSNSANANKGGSSKDTGGRAAAAKVTEQKAVKRAPAATAVPAKKSAVDTKAPTTTSTTSSSTAATKRKGLTAPTNTNKSSDGMASLSLEDDKTSGVPPAAKRPKAAINKVNNNSNNNNINKSMKPKSDSIVKTAKQSVAGSSSGSSSNQAARVQQKAVKQPAVAKPAVAAAVVPATAVAAKAAVAAKPVIDVNSERGGMFCSALVSFLEFDTTGVATVHQILQGVNSRANIQPKFSEIEITQLLKQLDKDGKVLIETDDNGNVVMVNQC
jgi:hypothetical protein